MSNARATAEQIEAAGVDELRETVHDTNATAHRTYDRIGALEARMDRFAVIESRVAVLEEHRTTETQRWSEINTKLDKLSTASENALKTLEQWATIRKTAAWFASALLAGAGLLGSLLGWLYHAYVSPGGAHG
jgi:predicted nuclease with TOPRIM domain